ncbi:CBASS cGAMP-activated phospholipase [Methylovorus glucosotrophus]|uniref:Patatin n=1 Tax=Methylovorus glucosotrophus (strain SIP3-4) TaxID=582744 RepID=C6XBA4_METGS|nr:CBASS cGAMP-activated phospholipase [Methylovorus glucosotrophus]ACT51874.1 Patatin [Methylovorus glucosotrophus SIP3-4]
MHWTKTQPFQALSLTGGGYRGLFTAKALQVIEDHIGVPIGQRFDLTCGTSIGGIVALAVAFEVPMGKVVTVFEDFGSEIFPLHKPPTTKAGKAIDFWRHAKKPRYSTTPLKEAITQLIDKDATLNDAKHSVAIPAVNVTQGTPQIFKTRHKPEWTRDWKFKVLDVALATAAAPTFFELAEVGGNLYADGGLFANAPDLVALHEAEHFFNVPTEAIRILSVGTTTKSYSVSFGSGKQFGIADWMEDQRLFSVTISAQQQFIDQLIQHKLQERYFRLDHEPSQEQATDLGLDVASETARKTLKALAEKVTSDVLNQLEPFLMHQPQLKLFKES